MIGTHVGNYRILSHIGSGGMGDVYLAEHMHIGRKVAIKVILPQFAQLDQIRARFLLEAKTMALLSHPNIVQVYEFFDDQNGLFLVLEFVDGVTLEEMVLNKTGPLSDERLVPLFRQILSGFEYAHFQGLVHRDIKPANIMITKSGDVKILDFGIAKIMESNSRLTSTGTRIGTILYMSPEQIRNQTLDGRSDIFSLGITLFFAATGANPYAHLESDFDISEHIVHRELPDPREYYPAVRDSVIQVIQKATQKRPMDRFNSCGDMILALDKSPSHKESGRVEFEKPIGQPKVAPKKLAPPAPRASSSGMSNMARLAIGGALVLVAASLVLRFMNRNPERPVDLNKVSFSQQEIRTWPQASKDKLVGKRVDSPTDGELEIQLDWANEDGKKTFAVVENGVLTALREEMPDQAKGGKPERPTSPDDQTKKQEEKKPTENNGKKIGTGELCAKPSQGQGADDFWNYFKIMAAKKNCDLGRYEYNELVARGVDTETTYCISCKTSKPF